MKILLCSPIYPPEVDETAQYSRAVALALQKAGHSVSVVTYANHPLAADGFSVFFVKKSWPTFVRIALYMLRLMWLVPRHDVVYVQEVIASGFPALWITRLLRKKMIVHVHVDELWKRTHTYETNKTRRQRMIALVLAQASKIIISSHALETYVSKTYAVPAEKCTVVYDPMPLMQQLPFSIEKNNNKVSVSCTDEALQQQCRTLLGDVYEVVFIDTLPLVEQQYHIQSSMAHIVLATDDLRPNDVFVAVDTGVPVIVMKSHPAVEILSNTDACIIDSPQQIPVLLDRIQAGDACSAHVKNIDLQSHVQMLEKLL